MRTYVWAHAPVGVGTYKARRGHQISGNYIPKQLRFLAWVLGLKFHSFARVASAPNHRACLSLLLLHFVKNLEHFLLFTQDTIWNRTSTQAAPSGLLPTVGVCTWLHTALNGLHSGLPLEGIEATLMVRSMEDRKMASKWRGGLLVMKTKKDPKQELSRNERGNSGLAHLRQKIYWQQQPRFVTAQPSGHSMSLLGP